MSKIQIIVGSVNGRAWQSANAAAAILNKLGHQVEVNPEVELADLLRDPEELLLVCCSTTGEGELPRNLYPVYLALDDQRVNLQGRHYGVIALGDSGYTYFAQAGFLMEKVLYQSGGKRIGKVLTLDAKKETNQPLAAALWAKDWITGFEEIAQA